MIEEGNKDEINGAILSVESPNSLTIPAEKSEVKEQPSIINDSVLNENVPQDQIFNQMLMPQIENQQDETKLVIKGAEKLSIESQSNEISELNLDPSEMEFKMEQHENLTEDKDNVQKLADVTSIKASETYSLLDIANDEDQKDIENTETGSIEKNVIQAINKINEDGSSIAAQIETETLVDVSTSDLREQLEVGDSDIAQIPRSEQSDDNSSNEFEKVDEISANLEEENIEYEYEISDEEDIDEEIRNVDRLLDVGEVGLRVNGENHDNIKDMSASNDVQAENISSDVSI